ncbi:hypothetical protein GQ473_05565 [archaeon]|nr:hypothetical protein [archaeon]
MKKSLLVFVIFVLICLSYSFGYAITQQNDNLIDETNMIKIPFAANLTNNTEFIICSQTDFSDCELETIELKYNYSYGGNDVLGDFLKIGDFFNAYDSDISTNNVYCFKLIGVANGMITLNASCTEKTNGNTDIDSEIFNVSFGNISIHQSSFNSNYNDYDFSVFPGENITIALYLEDVADQSISTADADIYYTLRDIKTGDVVTANTITYAHKKMTEKEGMWIENYTIPLTVPVGIIDFSAKDTTTNDFGGMFVYYSAIPFSTKLDLNETAINMGESIFINLTPTIYYGDISEIDTTIKYPNGTNENISLNNGNNYNSIFITPTNQQGTYNVSIYLTHTNGYTTQISKTFFVREYTIDVAKIKSIYSPGETVSISAALLDFDYNAVQSEINFSFFDSDDELIKSYKNSETIVNNNYHEVSYILPFDAITGKYFIDIVVKDEYDIIYTTTEEFNVGDALDYTIVDFMPELIDLNITTLDPIHKRINITNLGSIITEINVSIINNTDYVSVNLITLDETLTNGQNTYFYIEITPEDDMPLGNIMSLIKINISDISYEIPIFLNVSLFEDIELIDDMVIEIIADESNTVKIPVKNTGLYVLDNLELNINNEILEEYVLNIIYSGKIHANETENIEIDLYEMDAGFYNTSIEITNNNAIKIMNLNITVFDDFLTDIIYLDDLRQSLHEDIIQLQKDGVFIGSTIEDEIELLQSKINDLNDYYDSRNYSAAKELLDDLEIDADEIETTIISLQTAQNPDDELDTYEETDSFCGDGFCDDGELCSCSDCEYEAQCEEIPNDDDGSSGILFVIIFVILLVIGGIILVTSVVPDDWVDKKSKNVGSFGGF